VLLNGYFEAPTYHWEYYYLSPIALFGFYLAVFKFNFSLTLSTRAIAAFPYSFDETSISVGLNYSNSSFSYRSSCSSFDKSLTQLSNISS
jgi:hypothetical protein